MERRHGFLAKKFQTGSKGLVKFAVKLRASVKNDDMTQSFMLANMLNIHVCPIHSIRCVSARHCINVLGQLVHKHSKGIMSVRSDRQSSAVISGDSMPSKRWSVQRLQQASGLRRVRGLHLATGAVTNVVTYLLMCIPPNGC